MKRIKESQFLFSPIAGFNFDINYTETYKYGFIEQFEMHTHNEIEFYVSVEGDVSFLVNNILYPVAPGDIVISRPGEHHHCVCHSEKDRKYFCIWFGSEENSFIKNFFKDNVSGNLISPEKNEKKRLIDLCFRMLEKDMGEMEKYFCFFSILDILKSAEGNVVGQQNLPEDLMRVLGYIDLHISENVKISRIADTLYISESTIERRFKEYLKIKPMEFIRDRKMVMAAKLLKGGKSVLDSGLAVGYADNSYFIKLFKEHYGVTPYKYKKDYS